MQRFAVGQAQAWAVPSGRTDSPKAEHSVGLGAAVGSFWAIAVPQRHRPEPGLPVLFDPALEAAGAGTRSISTAHTSQGSRGSSSIVNGGAKRGPGLGAN